MININYIFTRLQLWALSPIFPIILSLTYFIIYKSYFDTITLCDGETIYQLKANLTLETAKYRIAIVNYEFNIDLYHQAAGRPIYEREPEVEQTLVCSAKNTLTEMKESLAKIREIETSIRKIEPGFLSPIQPISHLRIGR
jgi:hypothetical protein